MTPDNEAMLRRNNEHLIKANRVQLYVITFLISLVFLSVGFASQVWKHHPEPKLLALGPGNEVLPLPLLNEPFETSGIAREWADKNIRRLYSFTYDNIDDLPTMVGDLFWSGSDGSDGSKLDAYIKGMKAQGFFSLVVNERRLCTAFLSDNTRVLKKGIIGAGANERYGYRMQTPLRVECKNETDIKRFDRVVTVLAVRESPTRSPGELVISKVNSVDTKGR
ncbi:DotI/IcmL/TraM family protein [Porticoccaceae bacterium]|nr:DotI/IcmL/TraM family protein [Porticoccaceae bacterium]MDB2343074.1 DotI/IcmL/TraM family protein [Porticoccaceae bacterium]